MKFILNIGLNAGATETIAADVAKQVVAANEFLITKSAIVQSDTEPTLVCEVQALTRSPSLVLQFLYQIAIDLDQDCIAVYREATRKGVLIGPRAADWGEFNPEFFFTLDGSRLAQTVAA